MTSTGDSTALLALSFTGQTVLVTGVAQGLGRAIAHAFAENGAAVWGYDIDTAALSEIEPGGQDLHVDQLDVRDREAVDRAVGAAAGQRGRVDVLVNCAGGVCGQAGQPIEDVTAAQWADIFAVNVEGARNMVQAVVPGMKAAGRGRIITISSGAGLGVSLTGIQAYAAAKAAQIGLTRQLAHELGLFGITVNSVAPGFIRSNPTTERQWQALGPEGQDRLVQNFALRRLGSPTDIANAVLFLASDHAGWITGQTLPVDGGRL